MNGMQMQPPKKSSWKEIFDGLDIQVENTEKNLQLIKAEREEARSHIKGE